MFVRSIIMTYFPNQVQLFSYRIVHWDGRRFFSGISSCQQWMIHHRYRYFKKPKYVVDIRLANGKQCLRCYETVQRQWSSNCGHITETDVRDVEKWSESSKFTEEPETNLSSGTHSCFRTLDWVTISDRWPLLCFEQTAKHSDLDDIIQTDSKID